MQQKTTMDLAINNCQWLGNESNFRLAGHICENKPVEGKSYCSDHIWQVYQKGSSVHRRKDIRVAANVRLWEGLFNEAVEELINEGFDI